MCWVLGGWGDAKHIADVGCCPVSFPGLRTGFQWGSDWDSGRTGTPSPPIPSDVLRAVTPLRSPPLRKQWKKLRSFSLNPTLSVLKANPPNVRSQSVRLGNWYCLFILVFRYFFFSSQFSSLSRPGSSFFERGDQISPSDSLNIPPVA